MPSKHPAHPKANAKSPTFVVLATPASGLSWAHNALTNLGYSIHSQQLQLTTPMPATAAMASPAAILLDTSLVQAEPSLVAEALGQLRKQLEAAGLPDVKLLRLSASSDVLQRRYTHDTDLLHPAGMDVQTQVEQEQWLIQALKPDCDYHVDTSAMGAVDLYAKLAALAGVDITPPAFNITLLSFGYKYSVPQNAELVFDARVLPNPFYEESLRPFSGLDKPVAEYVFSFPQSSEFLEQLQQFISFSVPHYQKSGKTRLTVAIGCTGGQHRSVALAMALAQYIQAAHQDINLTVLHREMNHWPHQAAKPTPSNPT